MSVGVSKNSVSFNVASSLSPILKEWFMSDFLSWENSTFETLDYYLGEGDFLDVGAWVGPTTLYAAMRGSKCYSLEPSPSAFSLLQKNIEANPGIDKNIVAINKALGSVSTSGVLHSENLTNSAATLVEGDSVSWTDSATVDIEPISYFEKEYELDNIKLVKMDVEGYESVIIPELLPFLKKRKSTLMLSMHPWLMKNESHITSLLKETFDYILYDDLKSEFGVDTPVYDEHGGYGLVCGWGERPAV